MRRTHLRGHANILKRLLVHIRGFNLGLLMRTLIGVGTPRGLHGRLAAMTATVIALIAGRWHDVVAPVALVWRADRRIIVSNSRQPVYRERF
jgi:hypothetical protein